MRVLLVDNHDSYTYNLFQLLARVCGDRPAVVANDDPAWERLDLLGFDAAVISPGPGRPQRPRDVGRGPALLDQSRVPVLGVCLGHQMIAHAAGAEVALAPAPRHGHLTRVRHSGTGLFTGLPQDFTAVRYHSLAATPPLPTELIATAWAEDEVVMGLVHRDRPYWGVQFHPESIATEHGDALIANFLDLAAGTRPVPGRPHENRVLGTPQPPTSREPAQRPPRPGAAASPEAHHAAVGGGDVLHWRVLPGAVDTERACLALPTAASHAFWLDSSRLDDTGRFSFLGAPTGPRAEILRYRVGDGAVTVHSATRGTRREPGTIFDVLQDRIADRPARPPDGLPFDFTGGYVGYFGYELKADGGAAAAHRADTPDAVWMRADRFVAVDHHEGRTYVVARAPGSVREDDERWVAEIAERLSGLPALLDEPPAAPPPDPEPWLSDSRQAYLAGIKECLGYLAAGESYEICLTSQLRMPAPDLDDLAFYRRLRRANPAPYAALLRCGDLAVHSASPERFLRIGPDASIESRPIKGTAPRSADPAADAELRERLRSAAKTRAENLMIVDLLRNDLGRVCETGSVTVPEFMFTRSYASVHQLVSTVRGQLRPDVSPVRAVQACFPGGSMTGAPKIRTMELLDGLEGRPRGVYSGALGYLGYDGTADLGIVIRTAVRWRDELRVGAGGAIVLDSDPAEEYAEMLLKAAVPLRGLG